MDEIPSSEKEPESADAAWLMGNQPEGPKSPVDPAPSEAAVEGAYEIVGAEPDASEDAAGLIGSRPEEPKTPDDPAPSGPAAEGAYDIEGAEPDAGEDEAPVVPPIPVAPVRVATSPEAVERKARKKDEQATVDAVWTRWGEWGPDAIRLLGVAVGTLFLLYFTLSWGFYSFAFLLFIVGAVASLALSYPILITLERPVRVTPEQAVKDFYAALTHALPHYRRMWLLLSSTGKSCKEYRSFEAFQAHWKSKIVALNGGAEGWLNPFTFDIVDFRSEKSAGLSHLDAKFVVNVRRQGQSEKVAQSFPVEMGLVKGPDRMWYLNKGSWPGP